jgi:hypothetical protein
MDALKAFRTFVFITWIAIVSQYPADTPGDEKFVINRVVCRPWIPLMAELLRNHYPW